MGGEPAGGGHDVRTDEWKWGAGVCVFSATPELSVSVLHGWLYFLSLSHAACVVTCFVTVPACLCLCDLRVAVTPWACAYLSVCLCV